MSTHSIFSPSGAHRFLRCYPSLIADRCYPSVESEEAKEGTFAHEAAAAILKSGMKIDKLIKDCRKKPDNIIRLDNHSGDTDKIDAPLDVLLALRPYINAVNNIKSQDSIILIEQEVDLDGVYGIKDSIFGKSDFTDAEREILSGQIGTSDTIIYSFKDSYGGILNVIDLKYGKGIVVKAEGNEQLLLYGAGALEVLSSFVDINTVKEIRLYISQPRIREEMSEWMLTKECFFEEIQKLGEDFYDAAQFYLKKINIDFDVFTNDPSNMNAFIPSEKTCQWCKGKHDCPGLSSFVEKAIESQFDDLTKEKVSDKALKKQTASSSISLSEKYKAVELIELWCRSIRKIVSERLSKGDPVEGYKLVAGKLGRRLWTNEEKVTYFLRNMRFKAEEIFTRSLISPAKCEELVNKAGKNWDKFQKYIKQSEGKPIIVEESDKREALKSVMDEFEEIE